VLDRLVSERDRAHHGSHRAVVRLPVGGVFGDHGDEVVLVARFAEEALDRDSGGTGESGGFITLL
jgi:hypothetical protein